MSSRKSKQSTRSQTRARTGSKRDVSESQGRFQSHHSKFIKLSSKALRSSEDIYNRLCLDKELKIDTKSVIIGYKDNRGNSSSEISFKDFVPPPPVNTGNISYNQINYFRTKTKIIWFRQLRFVCVCLCVVFGFICLFLCLYLCLCFFLRLFCDGLVYEPCLFVF